MNAASVIALLNALQPYIPLALMGFKRAQGLVAWGADTVKKAVAEGRGITQGEWDQLNAEASEIHRALQSD